MVRPKNYRKVEYLPGTVYFKPQGIPPRKLQEERITLDELESLRLADVEGLYHEQAATKMGVSRATFGRIVQAARRKIASALVMGRAIRLEGGPVEFVDVSVLPISTTTAVSAPAAIAQTMHNSGVGGSAGDGVY